MKELITAITNYRSQNGLAAGNPSSEVEAYYAIHHPWMISKVGSVPTVIEDPVARWLNRAWRSPIKDWAESEMVNARMATCLTCEHYAADHQFDGEATRRLIILGAGKLKESGACKVHHWACGLAVLERNPRAAIYAARCWASPLSP